MAGYISSANPAAAGESGRPQVWIELGGSFTQLGNSQEPLQPDFTLVDPRKPFITEGITGIQKNPSSSWDGDIKVSIEPPRSDWTFSVGIRYGRDSRKKYSQQQTPSAAGYHGSFQGLYFAYQTATAFSSESHTMLDFQASKDVGLGMFGAGGHSAIGFGLRYAQLNSRSTFDMRYHPENSNKSYYRFHASFDQSRKFIGVGPEINWNASAEVAGNADDGGISFDWGVNAAVLFGRQRTQGSHRTTEQYVKAAAYPVYNGHLVYSTSASTSRDRNAVVPNVGGFAAISWFYPDAKVSVGYKADLFFNAIDGGIDTRKTEDRGFYGPYASISIGLGG
jgi:hypothetical protein